MMKNHHCGKNIDFWRNLMKFLTKIVSLKLPKNRYLLFGCESA